jgi:hypothetical protein
MHAYTQHLAHSTRSTVALQRTHTTLRIAIPTHTSDRREIARSGSCDLPHIWLRIGPRAPCSSNTLQHTSLAREEEVLVSKNLTLPSRRCLSKVPSSPRRDVAAVTADYGITLGPWAPSHTHPHFPHAASILRPHASLRSSPSVWVAAAFGT